MISTARGAAALALGLLSLPPAVRAQDAAEPAAGEDPLRFVTGNDFGEFSGETLDEGGMAVQVAREALAAAGRELEVGFDEWPVGYDAAAEGVLDAAFPWYYVPERDETFVYGDSVYEIVERLFHRVDDEAVPDVRGAKDLTGLVLCYPSGWSLPASIDAAVEAGDVERVSPGNMSRCFDLLAGGTVNLVLSPELQGHETIEANPALDTFDVLTASWEVTIRVLSPLLSKAAGGARACEAAVDFGAGLATIRANGLFDAIARSWFGPLAQLAAPEERYTVVRRTADGDEFVSGRAVGLSGDGFVLLTDEGVLRVPREELAWIGREGFEQFDAARDWCLDEAAVAAADAPAPLGPTAELAAEEGAVGAPAQEGGEAAGPTTAARRSLVVAGPGPLLEGIVPALASDWLERELVEAGETGEDGTRTLDVRDPARDPRLPQRVTLLPGDPASAFAALADGSAELVLSTRPPTAAEARALAPLGVFPSPETEEVVAIEAIAPVVHAERDDETIELAGLSTAVGGQVDDWSALGSATPGKLTVHLTGTLADSLADPAEAMLAAPGPGAVRHATREAVLAAVAADPGAIGLVRHPQGDVDYEGAGVHPLAIMDCGLVHAPDDFTAHTEEYPLVRRIGMYYSPDRVPGYAGALARHAGYDEGQEIFRARGLNDLTVDVASVAHDLEFAQHLAATLQNPSAGEALVSATEGARRLSSTFRFVTGSTRLDARAGRDLERLADWLRARDSDAQSLRIIGYADSVGGYARNCELSRRRARRVAEALAAEGVPGTPLTFGACEEAPVACNATAEGQGLNRRVEIWSRDAAR